MENCLLVQLRLRTNRKSMALVLASSAADTSILNRTLIHIQRPLALAPLTHHWQIITALSWPLLTHSYSKNLQKLSQSYVITEPATRCTAFHDHQTAYFEVDTRDSFVVTRIKYYNILRIQNQNTDK